MGMFNKPKPQLASFSDRVAAARTAIYTALKEHHLAREQATRVLSGIIEDQKMVAACAPMPPMRPQTTVVGEPATSTLSRL
jgi:hypothetical protein